MNIYTENYTRESAIELCEARPCPTWSESINSSEHYEPSKDWDLSAGYDGALLLAKSGYIVDRSFSLPSLAADTGKILRGFARSEEGETCDIDRLLDGEERCYRRRQKVEQPTISLVIDITAPWHVSAGTMLNRGSAIFCAVEQLESRGCSVEIVARTLSQSPSDDTKRTDLRILIKRHGEYLDQNILAFWLAHPAASRRIGFKLTERLPEKWCKLLSNNYGRVVVEEPRKEGETYYLTIPNSGDGWAPYQSKEGAEKQIAELLTTLNGG